MQDTYYRITDCLVSAGVDERDNPLGPGTVEVYVSRYPVLKRTPKGAWISDLGMKRFVLDSARKKFACPTPEEAKHSFLARKRRQINILEGRIRNAQEAIGKVDRVLRESVLPGSSPFEF